MVSNWLMSIPHLIVYLSMLAVAEIGLMAQYGTSLGQSLHETIEDELESMSLDIEVPLEYVSHQ